MEEYKQSMVGPVIGTFCITIVVGFILGVCVSNAKHNQVVVPEKVPQGEGYGAVITNEEDQLIADACSSFRSEGPAKVYYCEDNKRAELVEYKVYKRTHP